MIAELDGLTDLAGTLAGRARAAGVRLIWRAQARIARRVVVRAGRPESTDAAGSTGHGIHVVTPAGHSALGSRDDLRPEPALAIFDRTAAAAARGAELGLVAVPLAALPVARDRLVPPEPDVIAGIALDAVARRLAELEREIAGMAPGATTRVSWRAELDAWRIVREDGADVTFAIPRCTLGVHLTADGAGERHGASAVVFSTDPRAPWDDATTRLFLRRARRAAEVVRQLPGAPTHPAGSFPLVIDYALAKGLAHEAFGHAVEADGYRSSMLATDGRLRLGESVGADHVSIVDEPVEHDHAWQPYSSNGLRREATTIVERGRLAAGLSDPWTAAAGGVPLTGAARAETFAHAPQPRMTNIRIEVGGAAAAAGEFEDYDAGRVRDLLADAGVFRRHERVVFLSGYGGGQVNPASGDFVFNCRAIYDLGAGPIRFHKPAMFTGSMIGALRSVREAFGPLRLDAIGSCGKWGQSVPSSGGSHWFLVLEPDPNVRLGGS